jgi:hypothetical protein
MPNAVVWTADSDDAGDTCPYVGQVFVLTYSKDDAGDLQATLLESSTQKTWFCSLTLSPFYCKSQAGDIVQVQFSSTNCNGVTTGFTEINDAGVNGVCSGTWTKP